MSVLNSPVSRTSKSGGLTREMIASFRIKNMEAPAANMYSRNLIEIIAAGIKSILAERGSHSIAV